MFCFIQLVILWDKSFNDWLLGQLILSQKILVSDPKPSVSPIKAAKTATIYFIQIENWFIRNKNETEGKITHFPHTWQGAETFL